MEKNINVGIKLNINFLKMQYFRVVAITGPVLNIIKWSRYRVLADVVYTSIF